MPRPTARCDRCTRGCWTSKTPCSSAAVPFAFEPRRAMVREGEAPFRERRHALADGSPQQNIEDAAACRRSGRGVRAGGVGGLGIVAIALVAMFLGVDPSIILNGLSGIEGDVSSTGARPGRQPARRHRTRSSSRRFWRRPRIPGATSSARRAAISEADSWCCSTAGCSSACGTGGIGHRAVLLPGAIGRSIWTLSFFEELDQRFGAPGDFARAYVIAHEVGPPRADPAWHLEQGSRALRQARRGRRPTSCR